MAATRHNAAIIFIGFLIGLAYQEAVRPVRDALDGGDFSLVTAGLVTAFFFYGLSTFFGGFYHLLVAPWSGISWVANFLVIVLSAVILVFMAGVCTEQTSGKAEWGLFTWAAIYTALMTAWALGITGWLMWRASRKKQGTTAATIVTIADTLLGAALVALILVAFSDLHAPAPALLLAAVAVLRFVRDVQVLIQQEML